MIQPINLAPLSKSDIQIGMALPFDIYDQEGKVLLAAGETLTSEKQLHAISQKGMFHNPNWIVHSSIPSKKKKVLDSGAVAKVLKRPVEDPSETGGLITMSIDGSEESFLVRLIGVIGRDAFVVTHPTRYESFVFVKEGQNWGFRSSYALSTFQFTAQIEKVLLSPYPLLVISWPQETHMVSRVIRAARRTSCALPVSLRRFKDGVREVFMNGVVGNLSTGGLEFSSLNSIRLEPGEEIQLAFQLNFGDRRYVLEPKAKVMSEGRLVDDQTRHGLAFTELSDKDFAAIHAYVSDRLIQKMESPLYAKREHPLG